MYLCFYLRNGSKSWDEAQNDCNNDGTYLAIPSNIAKNEFLQQKLRVLNLPTQIWIGARDDVAGTGTNDWFWVNEMEETQMTYMVKIPADHNSHFPFSSCFANFLFSFLLEIRPSNINIDLSILIKEIQRNFVLPGAS